MIERVWPWRPSEATKDLLVGGLVLGAAVALGLFFVASVLVGAACLLGWLGGR